MPNVVNGGNIYMMNTWEFKIKTIFKSIWDEVIYGGHFVAISNAAVLLVAIILLNLNIDKSFILLVFSYLIVLTIYNANHLQELRSDIKSNPERTKHISKNKNAYMIKVAISGLLILFLLIYVNLQTAIFIIFLLIGGLLYPKKVTKKILGFKDYYTALFWSLIVFLPIFYFNMSVGYGFILFFLFVLIRSVLNAIYFDLKDSKADKKEGLLTFPVYFGESKTINILKILNIVSFIPLVAAVFTASLPLFSISLLLVLPYCFFYLNKSLETKASSLRTISYILVDGEYICWLLILLIGKVMIG